MLSVYCLSFRSHGQPSIFHPEFFFSIEGEARTCFREAPGGGAADASVPDEVIDFFSDLAAV